VLMTMRRIVLESSTIKKRMPAPHAPEGANVFSVG
jgi:hypothetical protein